MHWACRLFLKTKGGKIQFSVPGAFLNLAQKTSLKSTANSNYRCRRYMYLCILYCTLYTLLHRHTHTHAHTRGFFLLRTVSYKSFYSSELYEMYLDILLGSVTQCSLHFVLKNLHIIIS